MVENSIFLSEEEFEEILTKLEDYYNSKQYCIMLKETRKIISNYNISYFNSKVLLFYIYHAIALQKCVDKVSDARIFLENIIKKFKININEKKIENLNLLSQMAELYYDERNYDKAFEYVNKAIKLCEKIYKNKDNIYCYSLKNFKASILALKGEYHDAIDIYDKIFKKIVEFIERGFKNNYIIELASLILYNKAIAFIDLNQINSFINSLIKYIDFTAKMLSNDKVLLPMDNYSGMKAFLNELYIVTRTNAEELIRKNHLDMALTLLESHYMQQYLSRIYRNNPDEGYKVIKKLYNNFIRNITGFLNENLPEHWHNKWVYVYQIIAYDHRVREKLKLYSLFLYPSGKIDKILEEINLINIYIFRDINYLMFKYNRDFENIMKLENNIAKLYTRMIFPRKLEEKMSSELQQGRLVIARLEPAFGMVQPALFLIKDKFIWEYGDKAGFTIVPGLAPYLLHNLIRNDDNDGEILVIGNPTKDLEEAEKEAKTVYKLLGSTGKLLIGDKAKINEVFNKKLKIFHFAGHSVFYFKDSKFPYMKLADGEITAEDISKGKLHFNRGFIYLSSCESATIERYVVGIDVGLVPELISSGAFSIMASFTSIPDINGFIFAKEFYENLIEGRDTVQAYNNVLKLLENKEELVYYYLVHVGLPILLT